MACPRHVLSSTTQKGLVVAHRDCFLKFYWCSLCECRIKILQSQSIVHHACSRALMMMMMALHGLGALSQGKPILGFAVAAITSKCHPHRALRNVDRECRTHNTPPSPSYMLKE